jgi:hypothetical protein
MHPAWSGAPQGGNPRAGKSALVLIGQPTT